MTKETTGTVVSAARQWWLKVNTKPVRMGALDGATFPHVIRVAYTVDGKEYQKRKWIHAGGFVLLVGSGVKVTYCAENPKKAKIM